MPDARRRRRLRVAAAVAGAVISIGAASAGALPHWKPGISSGGAAQARMLTAAAPTGVTAVCVSATTNKVTVSWAAASHATGYTVYRKKTSGSYSSTASVTTTTTWTSSSLTSGKYTFEVSTSIGTKWSSSRSSPTASRTVTKTPKKCA